MNASVHSSDWLWGRLKVQKRTLTRRHVTRVLLHAHSDMFIMCYERKRLLIANKSTVSMVSLSWYCWYRSTTRSTNCRLMCHSKRSPMNPEHLTLCEVKRSDDTRRLERDDWNAMAETRWRNVRGAKTLTEMIFLILCIRIKHV